MGVAFARDDRITIDYLADTARGKHVYEPVASVSDEVQVMNLKQLQCRYVLRGLPLYSGNKSHPAHVLGIDRRTLLEGRRGGGRRSRRACGCGPTDARRPGRRADPRSDPRGVAPSAPSLSAAVGRRLQELRLSGDIPLSRLARRAGLTRDDRRRIEEGRAAPSVGALNDVAGEHRRQRTYPVSPREPSRVMASRTTATPPSGPIFRTGTNAVILSSPWWR
jgi:hypothetical protein